uniref:ATP synthase complex subunit 8 n=1 Tax=Charybdis bimaculata TaxID=1295081 RepID=A0A344KVH6_9EUCA|nr:ATP synthase F0 subunit 8 [Charybdis bimaculata]AVQ04895.1 ATP synthase F0 subunit 8 [Charybdis bimaculata]AXB37175.1 ATP synthase F0 subunit 8 [Charybdis bimaculata]
MPQMAPLMWLYLYCFFLLSLIVFMSINYFIKPYQKVDLSANSLSIPPQSTWKL